MPTAVEVTMQAIAFVVQTVPIGTNLGLVDLLWAMGYGSFLKSRGGIHPALKYSGFSDDEIRHSWSAMGYGAWKISELISSWQVYVKSQNEWEENRYGAGAHWARVISIDLTGFWPGALGARFGGRPLEKCSFPSNSPAVDPTPYFTRSSPAIRSTSSLTRLDTA